MAVATIHTAFTRGEIAPGLWGHTDWAGWGSAATTLRNMYVGYRGGAYSRAGTKLVGRTKQNPQLGQAPPRLVSFEFSITQTVVLEFGDFYLRFIDRGGYVTETPVTITGATNANPCLIQAVNSYNNGDWVVITGVLGMTRLNNNTYVVANATANTFTLQDADGNSINSTGFAPYTGGGQAARIYEVVTPYSTANDLTLLKFAQSADVISITHPVYPPYDLKRFGSTTWSLAPTDFGAKIANPTNATAFATTHPSSSTTPPTLPAAYAFVITAVDPKTGEESIASNVANVTDSVDIAATAGSLVIDWNAVTGAGHYNIYKAPTSYNTGSSTNALPVPVGAQFGFIGFAYGNQFVDSNIFPDTTRAPPKHINPFATGQILFVNIGVSSADWSFASIVINTATGSGFVGRCVIINATIVAIIVDDAGQNYQNVDTVSFVGDGSIATASLIVGPQTGTYPGVVSYFQQRRIYAATLNNPATYWASQPGAFTNFDTSIPVIDTDSISATVASEQVNGIQWMIPMPLGLVTFTGAGVWQIAAQASSLTGGVTALTPTSEVAVPQSSIGSSATVPPIRINWDILYLQAHGFTVRDLSYQIFFNIYTGVDISWQSSHLLIGHNITYWAWAEEPYRVLWAIREDGILLSLTYLKEQEVMGWARHDTYGQVKTVCTVSEPPVDALYLVVQRLIGVAGNTAYFTERMDNRIWNSVEDAWCVDCALQLAQPQPSAFIAFTTASGVGTAVTTPGVFVPGDVGSVIRASGGIAKMIGYTNASHASIEWIYPPEITPDDPLGLPPQAATGNWTMTAPVTTISGLDHLIGRVVTGLADGIPIPPQIVASDGTITLSVPASNVVVGLGYIAQLQTDYLETGQPTIQGRRKVIPAVTVRVEASCQYQVGANQADASAQAVPPLFAPWGTLTPGRDQGTPYTSPGGATVVPLFTGDERVIIPGNWEKPGQVAVQQVNALPLNVLACLPEMLPGDLPEMGYSPRQSQGDVRGRNANRSQASGQGG